MNNTTKKHEAEIRKLIARRYSEGETAEQIARRVWRCYGYQSGSKDGVLVVKMHSGLEAFQPMVAA